MSEAPQACGGLLDQRSDSIGFLTSFEANTGAVRIYQQVGFAHRRTFQLAWIIHEISSQKRKDALKGMMNTGLADPAFPFGASIT